MKDKNEEILRATRELTEAMRVFNEYVEPFIRNYTTKDQEIKKIVEGLKHKCTDCVLETNECEKCSIHNQALDDVLKALTK